MMQTDAPQAVHNLGDASFYLYNYHFKQKDYDGVKTLRPNQKQGSGIIYQVQPASGIFLSTGNWIPYHPMERKYEIGQKLVKIYYLESGGVTLIQNGKKAQLITEGIHLYLNKPSQGRVVYQPSIPIRYVSVLLFEDYIEQNIKRYFNADDFDFAEVYAWKAFNYNTLEIGNLFLQIQEKLQAGETSRLYYTSKVCELLSIVATNFHRQRQETEIQHLPYSPHEREALEAVRQAIEHNILNSPDIERLCKISTMGQTKLRESFKMAYGMPIGSYIRKVKMQYALLLLKKPKLTIGMIAAHLGYLNASKFSAAFKQLYHYSPREYRKEKMNHEL